VRADDAGVLGGRAAQAPGWHARASHIDEEELRCPVDVDGVEWDDQPPEELQIAVEDEDSGPAVDMRPVAAFADECLEEADIGTWVHKTDVREAFNEFARVHDQQQWNFNEQSEKVKFSNRLQDHFGDDAFDGKRRQGAYAFVGLDMTAQGREYLDESVDVEGQSGDAAAPIRGDD